MAVAAEDVVDPSTGRTVTTLRALNNVLIQAALQGQSVFCAAGDSGGTSFAGPQLNGVTSLVNQVLHHRVGLLNFALYALASSSHGYAGRGAPFRDIKSGDNWYWNAEPGYDQSTGSGVPDVANLLQALKGPF